MKLPKQPKEHILETLSQRFFDNSLPNNWITTKPGKDYGIDCIVSIFDVHEISPYEIHVQLKSSQHSSNGDYEKVRLKISTYNHLKRILHISMIVKYVADEKEAYFMLIVDVPAPKQTNDSFTINIPKTNKLSTAPWADIESYIKDVVDYKLSAGEAKKFRDRKKINK